MAEQYFAQLDENNVVITVAVTTPEFMAANPDRYPGIWVETFYDDPNKTYAAPGDIYNYETQDFEAPPEPIDK